MSVPADLGQLSADAYISGIIAGVLEGAGFTARVTAHSVAVEEGEYTKPPATPNLPPRKDKAVFLVKVFEGSIGPRCCPGKVDLSFGLWSCYWYMH